MPVIPALQRQGQEGWEFKANLRFTVIPLFQKTKTGIVVHASDPSTQDAEASLGYRVSLGIARDIQRDNPSLSSKEREQKKY